MKYGQQVLQSSRVSEWLNGPDADKIVKVDVYDGTYPAMTLSGGLFISDVGLRLEGAAGTTNYLSQNPVPAAVTGDLDVRVRVAMDDWTPANRTFLAGTPGGGANQGWAFFVEATTGTLRFFRNTSVGQQVVNSSVATGVADGSTKWVRVTVDVDNGASGSDIVFYLSDDGSTWTQLGTTSTQTMANTSSTSGVAISSLGDVNNSYTGFATVYRVQVRSGIGGTVIYDADFSGRQYGVRSFTESSSNAATVSLVSTASWTAPWSLPAGATFVKVWCFGSGGGGGAGRKGASLSDRTGGAGGGSGGMSFVELSASAFTGPVTITVLAGGTGGASQTTNSTNGANGSAVAGWPTSATTFGTFCGAAGGNGGEGGKTAFTGGGVGGTGLFTGATGGIGQLGSNANAGGRSLLVGSGGGGGSVQSTNTARLGGIGVAGFVVGSDVIGSFCFASGSGGDGKLSGSRADGGNARNGCGGGGGGAGTNDVVDSGKGGDGGAGLCVVVSYRDVDVQEFTASGTWNKPVGDYTLAKIFVVGGGGGGASGHNVDYATTIAGVSGGGGGAITCITIPFSQLGNTESVTVGLGGTGGASVTATATNGNLGNPGGQSSFGTWATALGGNGGILTAGTGPTITSGFSFNGGGGAGGLTTGANAGAGANSYTGGGGGGAGGTASNPTIRLGGAGGVGAAYTSAVTAATSGGNGPSVATVAGFYGGNGGAGSNAASQTGNASPGGNGAPKGGGGGGGGICRTGFASGAGGNGGNGYVCVVCV